MRLAVYQGCSSARGHAPTTVQQRLLQCSRIHSNTKAQAQGGTAAAKNLEDVDWDNVDWDTYDWRDYVDDAPGPAFLHTQQALQWDAVCKHISAFASTSVGKKRCLDIEIARTRERATVRLPSRIHTNWHLRPFQPQRAGPTAVVGSVLIMDLYKVMQILQEETKAVSVLEVYLATSLDFGGISTDAAETALRRANKGGMLTGDLLLGVASLIQGAQGIQSSLRGARSTAQGSSYLSQIQVLVNPCAHNLSRGC